MADKKISILLVEDNPGDASLIRRMLSGINGDFSVQHVTKLSDCLERLQEADIDMVLLDLGLPDSSGLETLARTRASAPEIPIIVITGLSERETAVEALKLGAQDFIAKERVDVHLLSRAIFRVMGTEPPEGE
ncbi:MAG: response regulator [Acidobacteria bacterium]|nr:response regulator [Acidobacteriota bacterium]